MIQAPKTNIAPARRKERIIFYFQRFLGANLLVFWSVLKDFTYKGTISLTWCKLVRLLHMFTGITGGEDPRKNMFIKLR